jgi:hypothetical protein
MKSEGPQLVARILFTPVMCSTDIRMDPLYEHIFAWKKIFKQGETSQFPIHKPASHFCGMVNSIYGLSEHQKPHSFVAVKP